MQGKVYLYLVNYHQRLELLPDRAGYDFNTLVKHKTV